MDAAPTRTLGFTVKTRATAPHTEFLTPPRGVHLAIRSSLNFHKVSSNSEAIRAYPCVSVARTLRPHVLLGFTVKTRATAPHTEFLTPPRRAQRAGTPGCQVES